MIDPYEIRKDFPILNREINGKPLIYFDNAATTQKPRQVINKIVEVCEKHYANIHRGIHTLSQEASELYEESHKIVKEFINAKSWREIVFTRNTTESINLIAYSYALNNLKREDKIVLTVMEHHSNLVPWQMVSRKTGAKLEFVNIDKDYLLDMDDFEKKIDDKTKIVSVTNISNVLGTINPIKEIIEIAKEYNSVVIVDAAQSAPHIPIDVKKLDIDFLTFSSHKMLGPTGIGVLYGKEELLEKMDPFLYGGDMISDVTFDNASWNDLPWKFEAGTPNIVGGIAFAEAVKYLERLGMKNIENYLKELSSYMIERLNELNGIKIYGPDLDHIEQRSSIISFNFRGYHPHDLAAILDREGIVIRSGLHCAHPLMEYLDIKDRGTARASLYIYNTKEEIDKFIDVLKTL